MNPAVFVADEQSDHPVDAERYMQLANDVLIDEQAGDEIEVNVIFMDETSIAELNEKFMGKTGPTDVLSFPIDEGPPESGRMPPWRRRASVASTCTALKRWTTSAGGGRRPWCSCCNREITSPGT